MQTHREGKRTGHSVVTVTCRFFGRYAEVLGVETLELRLPTGATATDAIATLRSQVTGGEFLPERPLMAINQHHALPNAALADGDELAVLPPLAGG